MANSNQQNRNRLMAMAAASFTEQSTCPIVAGAVGIWLDSNGNLKRRNADETDTLLLTGSSTDYDYDAGDANWADLDGTNPLTVPAIRMIDQVTGTEYLVTVESGTLTAVAYNP